jgi:transposase InsO family protein
VLDENPRQKLKQLGGPDGERKARAGDGTRRPVLKVFQRVECDAHKIDARMVVLVPSPHGGHEPRKIHRLWVIAIIEVASRAVLGYYLSMRMECSAEDVLRAIKNALTRWQPRELHWSEQSYVESAALPSGHAPQYIGACWDEFSVDGAMANICKRVETQLKEVVGAEVIKPQDPNSFSARRSKDDRPFIESFFKQLAGGGFHRLATTTGSKPADKRGADPEKAAMEREFQLEYAEELLDALIANYNARPHSGLGWRSPLQQLDFLTGQRGAMPRQANPNDVKRMVGIRKQCTVKGGVSTGRRLHFNFLNASYSAEWLADRLDLAGKNLWLQLEDEDDARFASVSTQQGEMLGVVRAAPPWHLSPHTLYMRQSIRALAARRLLHLSTQGDPVEELIRYTEGSMQKKLPAHPAYLEARRVLQRQAKATASSQASITPDTNCAELSLDPSEGRVTSDRSATPSQPPSPRGQMLPPKRKAKVW